MSLVLANLLSSIVERVQKVIHSHRSFFGHHKIFFAIFLIECDAVSVAVWCDRNRHLFVAEILADKRG